MKKSLFLIILTSLLFNCCYSQCNDLFFSEYIEGTSFNKAVEIYNPTNTPIDLSNYMIRTYYNGNTSPSTITLSGILNPGQVFIAAHPSASAAILAVADVTNSGVINFNGNDAVELYKISTNTSLDVIGEIGVNPGTEWLLNGVSGTIDKTLVRKNTVKSGTTTWAGIGEMQWDIHPVNTFSFLDAHAMKPCININTTPFTQVCLGTSITFSAIASGGTSPYMFNWSFGDSNTGTGANVNHTYLSAGNYTVTLVVTDSQGQFETQTVNITVYPNPIVHSITTNPSVLSGCPVFNVCITNINISSGTPPYNYHINFGNGNPPVFIQNPCDSYSTPGNYVITTSITDINGCSAIFTTPVSVTPPDNASFNYGTNSYCIADANPIPNITGTPGGTFSCNTCVVNPSTGQINLLASGTGIHTVTYTTAGTCPNSSQVNIEIYNTANTTINPAGPFCEIAVPTNLTAATPGGTWSGNGIIDTNLGTFDASAAGVGTHIITYTISGSCGNSSNINIDVLANSMVNINTPDTSICNDLFGFFLNADAGGIWSGINVSDLGNGEGFYNSAAIPAGTFYAVYTIPGLCGDADSIQINVSEYAVPSFTYSINGNTISFTNTSTTFGNTQALSYQWSVSSNGGITFNVFSTQTNPVTTVNSGTYIFCLDATTNGSCGVQSSCTTVVVNSVAEVEWHVFEMYPNPTNGIVNIELNNEQLKDSSVSIIIFDLTGRQLHSTTHVNSKAIIDLAELSSGIYYLQISNDKSSFSRKLILQK